MARWIAGICLALCTFSPTWGQTLHGNCCYTIEKGAVSQHPHDPATHFLGGGRSWGVS